MTSQWQPCTCNAPNTTKFCTHMELVCIHTMVEVTVKQTYYLQKDNTLSTKVKYAPEATASIGSRTALNCIYIIIFHMYTVITLQLIKHAPPGFPWPWLQRPRFPRPPPRLPRFRDLGFRDLGLLRGLVAALPSPLDHCPSHALQLVRTKSLSGRMTMNERMGLGRGSGVWWQPVPDKQGPSFPRRQTAWCGGTDTPVDHASVRQALSSLACRLEGLPASARAQWLALPTPSSSALLLGGQLRRRNAASPWCPSPSGSR